MEGTFKTSRTEIVVSTGSFEMNQNRVLEAWEKVRGDKIATMRIAHEDDGVHLLLYPFVNDDVDARIAQIARDVHARDAEHALIDARVFHRAQERAQDAPDVVVRSADPVGCHLNFL